jgi:DNA-binding Lrp family transcriptional regulator
MAREIGISVDELLAVLRNWQRDGTIRRMGAIVNHFEVGLGDGAMVVWKVPADRVAEVGALLAGFPEVSHAYERQTSPGWEYNLYTMVHGATGEAIGRTVERMSQAAGVSEYLILTTRKELKKVAPRYVQHPGASGSQSRNPKSEVRSSCRSIDDLDRTILDALQFDFPLSERPFDVVAERLGVDADLLWGRVEAMLEQGVIRRLGASLDSRKLGFCSTLAAVRVREDLVDRAAEIIGRHPEVTHSYLRDPEFNIWFTVIAPDVEKIQALLDDVRTALSLDASDVLNLPMTRMFKLDARFSTTH